MENSCRALLGKRAAEIFYGLEGAVLATALAYVLVCGVAPAGRNGATFLKVSRKPAVVAFLRAATHLFARDERPEYGAMAPEKALGA